MTKACLKPLTKLKSAAQLTVIKVQPGIVLMDSKAILRHIEGFYRELYAEGVTCSDARKTLFKLAEPQLKRETPADVNTLGARITKEEIAQALKDAPKGKASGP